MVCRPGANRANYRIKLCFINPRIPSFVQQGFFNDDSGKVVPQTECIRARGHTIKS